MRFNDSDSVESSGQSAFGTCVDEGKKNLRDQTNRVYSQLMNLLSWQWPGQDF